MSVPLPVIHCPSLDAKRLVMTRLYAAGFRRRDRATVDEAMDTIPGGYLFPYLTLQSSRMRNHIGFEVEDEFVSSQKRGLETLVNSIDHMLAYCHKHGIKP